MAAILSVDDSASIRQAVKIALTSAGHCVTGAQDGADGLQQARATHFDCIITDLNMPNMDGLSMIRALRALPAYTGVPILFLTTENADGAKRLAKSAGATGWITKPFAADHLVRIVQKVLAR
jgi:two-component system chemotaxis response regulator CheY